MSCQNNYFVCQFVCLSFSWLGVGLPVFCCLCVTGLALETGQTGHDQAVNCPWCCCCWLCCGSARWPSAANHPLGRVDLSCPLWRKTRTPNKRCKRSPAPRKWLRLGDLLTVQKVVWEVDTQEPTSPQSAGAAPFLKKKKHETCQHSSVALKRYCQFYKVNS